MGYSSVVCETGGGDDGAEAVDSGRRLDLPSGFELAQGPGHRGRVEGPLDHLDALVQGLLGVARQYGDRLLGQDRAGVHGEGGEVHRASGLGHPGGQGVADAVPAGESG